MRKICIINQKGGVGKTTTVVNLAAGLAKYKKKVLILDLDAQGNLSTCFNANNGKTMYDILVKNTKARNCILEINESLHIVTSDKSLAEAELILAGKTSRELILKRAMGDLEDDYDYVLIDCPPSISLLNQNALLYADEAFIPVSTDFLALNALSKMIDTIEETNNLFDHDLKIAAVIPTQFDKRNGICKKMLKQIRKDYDDLVTEPIRINSKLIETSEKGKPIFEYARSSRGAQDYQKLVQNTIEQEC